MTGQHTLLAVSWAFFVFIILPIQSISHALHHHHHLSSRDPDLPANGSNPELHYRDAPSKHDWMPDYVLHITSEWKVLGCTNRNSVMVNGSIPGPTIEMYEGQTIVVRVINHLEASPEIQHLDMMVHWHGVRVHPMMDGTPVSQYPIKPEKCFDYVLSALPGSAGTYMYHEHAMSFAAFTMAGVFLIKEPKLDGPYQSYYDQDRKDQNDISIFFSENYLRTDVTMENGMQNIPFQFSGDPENILINGKGYSPGSNAAATDSCTVETIKLKPGETYRLRFISGTALSYLYVALQGHNFTVIEVDAEYTQPLKTSYVDINTGQRYSVLVKAKTPEELAKDVSEGINAYTLHVSTLDRPTRRVAYAIIYYDDGITNIPSIMPSPPIQEYYQPTPEFPEQAQTRNKNAWYYNYVSRMWVPNYIRSDLPLQPRVPYTEAELPPYDEVRHTITLNIDRKYYTSIGRVVNQGEVGGRYYNRWLTNDKTWMGPRDDVPTLVALANPVAGKDYLPTRWPIFSMEDSYDAKNNLYAIKKGDVIEIVIQNIARWDDRVQNFMATDAHPYHIHGQHPIDIGGGVGEYNGAKNELDRLAGTHFAIRKDTSTVHRYGEAAKAGDSDGWRAYRMVVEDPGSWPLHCHMLPHMISGMSVNLVFGEPDDIKELGSAPVTNWAQPWDSKGEALNVLHIRETRVKPEDDFVTGYTFAQIQRGDYLGDFYPGAKRFKKRT